MRIRSIMPKFWRSDDVDRMDWGTRLLFIGLWSYVDDNGVGRDRLGDIVGDLFSGDLERDTRETFARVADGLQQLAAGGQIERYEAGGKRYLYVCKWSEYQRVDRPNKARYPLPTCGNADREELAGPSRGSRDIPVLGEGEKGRRGEEEKATVVATPEPSGFADWYALYPKRVGRGAAIKAYRAALKKTDAATLRVGLTATTFSPDLKFVPNPATWLNQERWSDEQQQPGQPAVAYETEATRVYNFFDHAAHR